MDISSQVKVVSIGESPALRVSLRKQVSSIFDAVNARRQTKGLRPLTDGTLFTARAVSPERIECEVTNYSRFIAQKEKPELFAALKIRPLAVSGAISTISGWLFAKRSMHLTQYPGHWELAPAGGLKTVALEPDGSINMVRALFNELSAELGLDRKHIQSVVPLSILEDPEDHVIDVTSVMTTNLSKLPIMRVWKTHTKPEHDGLCFVEQTALGEFSVRQKLTATAQYVSQKFSAKPL